MPEVVLLHDRKATADSMQHTFTIHIHSPIPFIDIPTLQEAVRQYTSIVDLYNILEAVKYPDIYSTKTLYYSISKLQHLAMLPHAHSYLLLIANINGASNDFSA